MFTTSNILTAKFKDDQEFYAFIGDNTSLYMNAGDPASIYYPSLVDPYQVHAVIMSSKQDRTSQTLYTTASISHNLQLTTLKNIDAPDLSNNPINPTVITSYQAYDFIFDMLTADQFNHFYSVGTASTIATSQASARYQYHSGTPSVVQLQPFTFTDSSQCGLYITLSFNLNLDNTILIIVFYN